MTAARPKTGGRRVSPPSIDLMLGWPEMAGLVERFGRVPLRDQAREAARAIREAALPAEPAAVADFCRARLEAAFAPSQRRVLNLTGTVLHTNLGRALLAEDAIAAALDAMRHPTTLEYELEAGRRGERDAHIEPWLTRLTGAEAAVALNNNAGAVFLLLSALASGREVIVSRGELVEIGGSFRVPDIMREAGCRLVEVGTTNRTHLSDYERAIGPDTALIMKVHTSNYAVQGFAMAVAARELAPLARAHGLPLVEDLGSGTLVDLRRYGLPHEPTAAESIAAGVDAVTFSGDKLLGGPQAGFIAGKRELVRRIAKHPLKRALRLDKIRLAAIEATLKLYADPDRLRLMLPTIALLSRPAEDIEAAARRLFATLEEAFRARGPRLDVEPCRSQIGSGALPLDLMPSWALTLRHGAQRPTEGATLEALAARLRALAVPVIGRLADGRLWLDLRCLSAEDEALFVTQLIALEP
jgi:L-seryl-tRNA(Ser) seleniumtransferase